MTHSDKQHNRDAPEARIRRRDILIASAGLTAAAVSGTTAAAQDAQRRHQPSPGFEIPLAKSWIGDHYNDKSACSHQRTTSAVD